MTKYRNASALAMLAGMICSVAAAQEPGATESSDLDALLDDDAASSPPPATSRQEGAPESSAPPQDQSASAQDEPASAEGEGPLDTIPVASKPPPPPAAMPEPPRQLEEIVVTARKREESLQQAPVVVSALSQKQLERYNVSDMTKIAEMTPQLFVSSGSNGNGGTITMRGIGSSSTTSGFDQAVSINIDGIQYSRANVLHQGYFDVGQVEVLKGPQSLFFGKSSSAGVISLHTADPDSLREAQLKVGYELNARQQWYEGYVSGRVTDDFSARLAGRFERIAGYIDNLAGASTDPGNGETIPPPDPDWPHERQAMARLTLAWQPAGDFDAKLKLSWVDLENGGPSQSTELIDCSATGSAQLHPGEECTGNWQVQQNDLPPGVAATEAAWNHAGGRLYFLYKAHSAAATLNYDAGDFHLTSVTGYYRFDSQYLGDYDFTGTAAVWGAEHPRERALSQELRLLSDFDGSLNFMVGGYFQRKQFDFGSVVRLLPLPQDPASGRYTSWDRDSATTGKAWSVFGQLLWKITDTLDLAAGARYSNEAKDSYSVNTYVHPLLGAGCVPGLPLPTPPTSVLKCPGERISASTEDRNVSPEATLSWHPDPDVMIYGAYKQGFKSGGYSNSALLSASTTAEQQTFRPETVAGYEAGLKSSWLDNSLQLNLAAYNYEFKDLQVNFFDSSTINFITQNAATATTRGAELEMRWLPPIEGLDLHGAASWNRAVYGTFLSYCYAGQSYEQGCNLDADGNPAGSTGDHQRLDGTPRPIAPKVTASLGFLYEMPLWNDLVLALGSDASYVGRYLMNPLGRPIYQDGYVRADASISLSPASARWQISLIGRNLTDAYTIYDEGDSPLSGQGTGQHEPANVLADQIGVIGRPRELAVQVTYKFGEY